MRVVLFIGVPLHERLLFYFECLLVLSPPKIFYKSIHCSITYLHFEDRFLLKKILASNSLNQYAKRGQILETPGLFLIGNYL